MSFIKIKDPRKREELIKDLIETRKRIKDNFIARKVGEIEYQTGLTKLFKPVTETQKATAKEITEAQKAAAERIEKGLLPIKEAIEGLTIETGEPIPAIEYTEEEKTELGDLAADGLTRTHGRRATQSDLIPVDPKKGLYRIGITPITIKNNDLYISNIGKTIKGTPGLWELLMSHGIPDKAKYEEEDLNNYINIMAFTNAAKRGFKKNAPFIGGNKKMNDFIKPYVSKIKEDEDEDEEETNEEETDEEETDGEDIEKYEEYLKKFFNDPKPGPSGTDPTYKASGYGLILPSDPNALIDRFDLLFSSKKAGHTGVKNEIVAILDELKRQKVINVNEYKKLNSLIKK